MIIMFGSFLPSCGRRTTTVYSGQGADIVTLLCNHWKVSLRQCPLFSRVRPIDSADSQLYDACHNEEMGFIHEDSFFGHPLDSFVKSLLPKPHCGQKQAFNSGQMGFPNPFQQLWPYP